VTRLTYYDQLSSGKSAVRTQTGLSRQLAGTPETGSHPRALWRADGRRRGEGSSPAGGHQRSSRWRPTGDCFVLGGKHQQARHPLNATAGPARRPRQVRKTYQARALVHGGAIGGDGFPPEPAANRTRGTRRRRGAVRAPSLQAVDGNVVLANGGVRRGRQTGL